MIKIIKKLLKKFTKLSLKVKIIIIFLILILFIIFFITTRLNKDESYQTTKVKRTLITEIIDETGTVTTTSKTDIYSPSTGIIEELYVDNKDIVGLNQKLFKVKSTASKDEKATAYASLVTAQASVKTAEASKMTLQTQLEQARQSVLEARINHSSMINDTTGSYTQIDKDVLESTLTSAYYNFNTIEKKYLEADVAINAAKASLISANLTYESTKDKVIYSPTIGTVSNLSVGVGDSITATTASNNLTLSALAGQTTAPVLTIANFSSNTIIVKLNESDISNIKTGQKVKINPDALKDVEYSGVVSRVDDIGKKEQGVVTYNVYVTIIDADQRLKSAMTVDVNIITQTVKNALSIPNSAIKPYQGGRAVRVYNQKTKEIDYLPVKIGAKGTEFTQIIKGLKEGQEIITSLANEQTKKGLFGF